MNVLVGFEFSAVVRDAMRARGHDAWSCDILPTEGDSRWHYLDDVFAVLHRYPRRFDLAVFHPPCRLLTVAGARWWKGQEREQAEAIALCERLMAADIPSIALENPIGVLSTRSTLGKPTQIVQPWWFGHGETKATCLWLKNLPPLTPTRVVAGREARVHRASPGPDRWKERSRTLPGFARAMATQWAP